MPRRRKPLVCQYIENLSGAALTKYAEVIREMVAGRHGLYALYRRDKLYYVGLATNLRGRLKAHLNDRHKGLWDRFSVYLTIEHSHLKELESLVIRIADPKGNRHSGKFARSENLLKQLRRRLKEQHQAELMDLIGRRIDDDEDNAEDEEDRPVLAGYFDRAKTLRGKYQGKEYRARVRLDGTIRAGKKVFESPSRAASHIIGGAANGWMFWKYERAPGQWVRLSELRRQRSRAKRRKRR